MDKPLHYTHYSNIYTWLICNLSDTFLSLLASSTCINVFCPE